MLNYLKIIMIIYFILFISACSSIAIKPDQVKVNISNMRMLESTIMEQRYQVQLRIINRSAVNMSVNGISFDIELNGKDFASGISNDQVTIEAFSEGTVSVNVTSTIFGILRQIDSLKQKPQLFKYEINGYLYTGNSALGIPFDENGEIDLNLSAYNNDLI